MKTKTIKMVLRKKVDEWLSTIEDEELRELLEKNVIVTGGCVASMLLKEQVNDFDVYFKTYDAALKTAQYYVSKFETLVKAGNTKPVVITVDGRSDLEGVEIRVASAGIASEGSDDLAYEYFEGRPSDEAGEYVSRVMQDPGDIQDQLEEEQLKAQEAEDKNKRYRPVFLSTNAITLSNKMQLILRFVGEADKIHENFDFVHCTNYWTSWNSELVLRQPALESLLARELRYVGSRYPICSLIRLRKFIKRNWTINAGQILKMAMQVSQLDLENVAVLRDQLTGVDVAYFNQVIYLLKENNPEKVNYAYLIEIIDRMF